MTNSVGHRVLTRLLVLPLVGGVLIAQTPARPTPPRQGPMPTLPLTQLDDRGIAADLDTRAFTLTFAQPVPIKDVLLLLVRGTSLSVIPDPAIGGSFIGELKNVSVRQALELILPPLGLDYSAAGAFIRVFARQPETRIFDLNYVVSERVGESSVGSGRGDSSFARVSTTTRSDVFEEVARGVKTLLSDKATFNVDRKAGLVQVTDLPERLDRVERYLDAVQDRVQRQVEIDARVLEVELNDEAADGLDWTALGQTDPAPSSPARLGPAGLTGLRVTDLGRFMNALASQGKVSVVARPRLLALNNEPAVVRARSIEARSEGALSTASEEFSLSVTPQIAPEGIVMLSLSPIVSLAAGGGDANHSEPQIVREADTLARVANGETIVMAGFAREHTSREQKNAGTKGGWFGRSTVVTKKRIELLVLLTPRILS